MSSHSVAEARNNLSGLIERALKGEAVVITRHGRPVVELKAVASQGRPMTAADVEWLRAHRVNPLKPFNSGELLRQMRDEDDERLLRR
jgi:prevent-host-death family protein